MSKQCILMTTMSLDIGGAETHIVELSKGLKNNGYKVIVVSNGGIYVKELESNDIIHYNAPLHTKNPISVYKSYRILKKIIIRENVDIIHSHARIPAFISSIVSKKLDVPFVTTVHGKYKTGFGLDKITKWGQYSLSVSQDISHYLTKYYNYPQERIQLTINGIDTNKFSPNINNQKLRKDLEISDDDFVVLSVSRIDKGSSRAAFLLVDIAQQLSNEINNLKIVIVGGGNALEKLESRVNEANKIIGKNIIQTLGSRDDIHNIISLADIFVGVSRAALEAMAMKKPTVVTGDAGHLGILNEENFQKAIDLNFTCRGMETATKEKLYTDILKLYNSKSLMQSNAQLNYETVKVHYSLEKMISDAQNIYYKAIEKAIKSPSYYHAVISGYYGFDNSGDEALLYSIIRDLRGLKPDIRLTVLSNNPVKTADRYKVHTIKRNSIFSIIHTFKKSNLLISGGGNLVQDETSLKSLIYYIGIIWLAKKKGLKVMIYANGIGPLNGIFAKRFTKAVLNNIDVITLREGKSKDLLNELNINKPTINVTADPVLNFEIPSDKEIFDILKEEEIDINEKYAVFSVRPWKNQENRYIEYFAKAADYIHDKYTLVPIFVPMHFDKDIKTSQKIISLVKCKAYIINNSHSVRNIIGIISKSHVVIGMRLHSLIYAAIGDVPCVGIVYDPKVRRFIEMVEQVDGGTSSSLSEDKLKVLIDEIINKHSLYKARLQKNVQLLKTKAFNNAEIAIDLLLNNK